MNVRLIGLTGRARAGKDQSAEYLRLYRGFARIALADPLKAAAAAMFGVPREDFDDPETKELVRPYWNLSPRQMAQKLGTEAARDTFGADIWLKRATLELIQLADEASEVAAETFGPVSVVVTDVRFDNEAEWIKRHGGRVIRIVRPGTAAVAAHASEAGVSDWLVDAEIVNDGDLTELRSKVLAAVGEK